MTFSSTSRPSVTIQPQTRQTITGRVITRFPATVEGTGGITVSKDGGNWLIEPTWGDLALVTSLDDPETKELWARNPDTNEYSRVAISAIVDALLGGQEYFSSYADVEAATLAEATTNIVVAGYSEPGDAGGAIHFKVVESEPSHPGKLQTANGVWLEIFGDTLDARAFGAKFDGATNDTTSINNAITSAVALGVWLELPAGTAMVSQITVPSNLRMRGIPGKTILKRTATATETSVIVCGSAKGFALEGIEVDGNKANNANAVHLIVVAGGAFTLRQLRLRNAKAVSGGYGGGLVIVNTTDAADGTRSFVSNIETFNCDVIGVLAYHCRNIDFDCITDTASGGGLQLGIYANPIETDTCSDISVRRVRATGCAGTGVSILGGGTSGYNGSISILDATVQQVHRVTIDDVIAKSCGQYGVVIGGTDLTVSNVTASGCASGVLFIAHRSSLSNVTTFNNTDYGMDAGAGVECIITGHKTHSNSVGVNLGGQQRSIYTDFEIYDCDTHIGAQRYEGDGINCFPLAASGRDLTISNGVMRGAGVELGIYARQGLPGLTLNGVRAFGFAAGKDYLLETPTHKIVGCTTDRDISVAYGQIGTANELIISDCTDYYYLYGTTAVQRMLTQSQATMRGRIPFVTVNSAGTGGWTPGAQYAITFTGDGTGAAGYVQIAQDGYAGAAVITNLGNNYTTCTATVGLSGVTLTVGVGLSLQDHGRQITFYLQDGCTFEYGLSLTRNIATHDGANYVALAGTKVVFQNVYGGWHQIAPAIPANFNLPASVTIGAATPIVGSTGATNNAVLLASGTGGKTVQAASGLTYSSGTFALSSSSNYMPQFRVTNTAAHASASYWYLTKNRSGGSINAGDPLGTMLFTGYDTGSVERYAAYIAVYGTSVGSGYIEGKIYFYVMDTAGTLAARATLNATDLDCTVNIKTSTYVKPGSYTVATLPAGVTGAMVWCSNCRVFNGAGTQEGAGAGTGGLVTYNGSAWKIAGTNVTAVA